MILDEPTNHLDIQSRNILIESLKDYKGTFIVVSHDRHFLDQVANKIWYAEEKTIHTYPGTYTEFHYHQTHKEEQKPLVSVQSNPDTEGDVDNTPVSVENKREQAERRNRLYKELSEKGIENMENWQELSLNQLQTALGDLETRIHSFEDKKAELEDFLADPSNFKDKQRADQVSNEYSEVNDALKKSYERWELVTAHIESSTDRESL